MTCSTASTSCGSQDRLSKSTSSFSFFSISDCKDQFNSFRDCIIREKKVFRSLIGNIDLKANPQAIPDYLEKHFKEKEAMKKKRKMMGLEVDELKDKIRKVEEDNRVQKKKIDTMDFKNKREILLGGS